MSKLNYYAKSFVGRRKNNQDSVYANEISPDIYFFAVADGMGGAAGGEIASSIAIETACSKILELKDHKDLKYIIDQIFAAIQIAIKEKIISNPELTGMGTTLTCLLLRNNKYVWGNIGDSRIYKIDSSGINQITKDHSYIQDYFEEKGERAPDELVNKFGNIITRVLDGNNDKPDIFPEEQPYQELNADEMFVLCSDGLIVNKTEEGDFIRGIMLSKNNIKKSADNLISYAYDSGSTDNITIVVVENGNLMRDKSYLPPVKQLDDSKINGVSRFSKFRQIFILAVVILAVIIGLFYAFKKGVFGDHKYKNDNTKIIESSVPKKTYKSDSIIAKPFEGFEVDKRKVSLDYDKEDIISWYGYIPDNQLANYRINLKGNSFEKLLNLSKITHIKLSDLGITNVGSYKLEIEAILIDGQIIKGDTDLSLDVY